jgi:predicted phosphodiesterase
MTKRTLKQDIVKDYLSKYPGLPNKTLATLIFQQHEGLFNTVEDARSAVRYYQGANGQKSLKHVISSGHITEANHSTVKEGLQKLGIISRAEAPEHLVLGAGRYLILSDIHLPFHNEEALAAALEWAMNNQITDIILNGDILDCYDVSRFSKEIKRPKISEELEMGRQFFAYLRDLFPTQNIYYKIGNAREFSDMTEFGLESLLKVNDFKIKVVNREMIKIGKLIVLHGHELGESVFSPVNPARGMFLKAKASILFGHNHQVSHHSENNLNGDQVGVWSTGCLCELTPEYRMYAYTKWSHGFAFVEVLEDGTFHVNNMKILNGKII